MRLVDRGKKVGREYVLGAKVVQQVVGLVAQRHVRPCLFDIAVNLAQAGHRLEQWSGQHQRLYQCGAKTPRQALVQPEHLLLRVTHVAAEQFIAAVTGEHAVHAIFVREPGAIVGRYRRRVPEGLIVEGGNLRDGIDDIGWRYVVLMMLAAEVLRGNPRVVHLVVTGNVKAD